MEYADISTVTEQVSSTTLKQECSRFINVVLQDDRNSRYIIAMDSDDGWSETCVRKEEISSLNFLDDVNYYMTHNGFIDRRRRIECTRQINALFFDIDVHNVPVENCLLEVKKAYSLIRLAIDAGVLPKPTFIVYSGRGLHLYYVLERSIPYRYKKGKDEVNDKGVNFFQKVQEGLACVLDKVLANLPSVQVDRAVFDHTRVARIPGSINTKTGTRCRTLSEGGLCDLYELYKDFCPKETQNIQTKPPQRRKRVYSEDGSNALAYIRLRELKDLQRVRRFDCMGYREKMCFLFYNNAVQIYSKHDAKMATIKFNKKFRDPLDRTELSCIFRNLKTIYYYSAGRFAEELGMTEDEKKLIGFRSASSKKIRREYARQRTKAKRNARDEMIIKLYVNDGKTQKEVAQAAGCSRRTVCTVLANAGLTSHDRGSKRHQTNVSPAPQPTNNSECTQKPPVASLKYGKTRKCAKLRPRIGVPTSDIRERGRLTARRILKAHKRRHRLPNSPPRKFKMRLKI